MSKKKTLFFSSEEAVALGVPLIMEVDTTDTSSAVSASDSIILPFDEGNTVNLQIDWGDGSALETYTNTNNICLHQYSIGGLYDIKIYNLNGVSRIPWNITNVATNRKDFSKFYDLKQFGDCEIYQLNEFDYSSFEKCINLDVTASDIAERCIELCVNTYELFRECSIVEAKNSTNWDTSNITVFQTMFFRNTNIIIDCSNWEMSQATSIRSMFSQCGNINPDVTNWDISSSLLDMDSAFADLPNFERDLSNWDVSGVEDMGGSFQDCTSFTGQGLENWNTSSALNRILGTFRRSINFNGNLQNFDVSGVTTMSEAFRECTNFIGNGLENWNTSSALTNLQSTFQSCTNFNKNLSNWDVSGVTTMREGFQGTTIFEGNGLDTWVTSSLTNLEFAFQNCTNFNQDLSGWDFSNVTDMRYWGDNWGMDTNNYDKLLISLASQTLQSNLTNVRMSSKYSTAAAAARSFIISTYNWQIIDDGQA